MGYTASELIWIAKNEIGYHEKNSDKNLDNKTASNDGSGNHTKYARDLHAAGYYNGDKCGFAWCDVFVDWCFYMLAGKNAKKAQELECQTGELGAGCIYSAQYYRKAGRFGTTPKRGAQIFFGKEGDEEHTGIVTSFGDGVVKGVDGNSGNKVSQFTYRMDDPYIVGYGYPKFDNEMKYKVNDVLHFIGARHYLASYSDTGSSVAPGKVKVTGIAEGAKHPYHVRTINSKGEYVYGVYGWVNEDDLIVSTVTRTYYVVEKGDTLNEIAKRHGFTVEQLAKENNIKNVDLIYVGDRIYFPTKK